MQENNFEKEVQQKMGELRFAPNAPVWAAVEARIRKKKEKRRFLLWIFFGALLLGGGGTGLLLFRNSGTEAPASIARGGNEGVSKQTIPAVTTEATPNGTGPAANSTVPGDSKDASASARPAERATTDESRTATGTPTITPDQQKKVAEERSGNVAVTPARNPTSTIQRSRRAQMEAPTKAAAGHDVVTSTPRKKADTTPRSAASTAPTPTRSANNTGNTTASAEITDRTSTASAAPVAPTVTDTAAMSAPPVAALPATTAPDTASSLAPHTPPPTPPQHRSARPWQWRVYAAAGSSSLGNLPGHNKTSMDVQNSSGSGVGSGVPPMFPQSYTAPARNAGISFEAGVSMIYPLSKRVQLEAGLSYHFLSTTQRVGMYRPANGSFSGMAASGSYYSYGNETRYRNEYHTLSVPVLLGWNLHPRITLSGGIGTSYLVATNALAFNESTGISYTDASGLNRFGASLLGSARYRFWKRGTRSLDAGPVLQLGLSPLEKSSGKRLSYVGLQAGFQF